MEKDLPAELKSFIENQNWIFAKTYANTYPHEYIMQEQVDNNLYLKLVDYIDTFGYTEYFYEKEQVYYDFNRYTYWHMENIINRCVIEDTYHIRKRMEDYQRTHNSWQIFDKFKIAYQQLIEINKEQYENLLKIWDKKFIDLGKDTSHTDWENFRMLRVSREEDWSDWLVFLLQNSSNSILSKLLFSKSKFKQDDLIPVEIFREEPDYSNSYRADVIIRWENEQFSHVEIKVGDKNLSKTFKASERFRETFNVKKESWENYILLLSNQTSDWEKALNKNNIDVAMELIIWEEVSMSLRKAICIETENNWRVWAYSFLGIIEQKLLNFSFEKDEFLNSQYLIKKIELLEKSL